MSTRSEVYIQEADGSLHGCYIHCDGYPSVRGFECLAHAEAGTLRDFIAEHCENDVEEDGFDFAYLNEEQLREHIVKSDRSWVYVYLSDGSWHVWQQTYNDGKFGVEDAGDLLQLVAKESQTNTDDLRLKIIHQAKKYRRRYGKNDSCFIHIAKVTPAIEGSVAKLEERRSQDCSFEEATRTFNQLLDTYRSEDWKILYSTDEQFIAKKGITVALVNKI